jgi:hypothetical protein
LSSFLASVSLSAVLFTLEVRVFLIVRKRLPDLDRVLDDGVVGRLMWWTRNVDKRIGNLDSRNLCDDGVDNYLSEQSRTKIIRLRVTFTVSINCKPSPHGIRYVEARPYDFRNRFPETPHKLRPP